MKKSAKTIAIAVMTIVALGGFAPAKADVSMGVTSGYMAVPASERWAAVQSRGNEALETSAADIEAAVNSGDQAEAGKLLAQLYSGAAARAAAPVYAAPARAAAVRRVTRSSEDPKAEGSDSKEEGKDKDKDKEKDKEEAADAPKPAAPAAPVVLDALGQMAADLKALNDLSAANAAEAASKEKEEKEEAESLHKFAVWAQVFAVSLVLIVLVL